MAILLSSIALTLMVVPLISVCCVIKSKTQCLHFREILKACRIIFHKIKCSSATFATY